MSQRMIKKGTEESVAKSFVTDTLGRISYASDVQGLSDCDLVIEVGSFVWFSLQPG